MNKIFAFFVIFLLMFVSVVNAAPKAKTKKQAEAPKGIEQIEVIGLVPGLSTQDQVEKKKADGNNEVLPMYVIGGYRLFCIPEYKYGILSHLICATGKNNRSKDEQSGNIVSNEEVHETLVKGFTKKFGPPTAITNSSVTNKFSATFNQNKVKWLDSKGNRLMLSNFVSKVDEGILSLDSAQSVKGFEDNEKAKDSQRKF